MRPVHMGTHARRTSEALVNALAPDYQFRADTVTLTSGNTATIPNRRSTDALVLTSGTLAAPASDALFGGAQSITFNGTQWLDSNLAPSVWKFLHDGTGFEEFTIFAPSQTASLVALFSTRPGTSVAEIGFTLFHQTNHRVQVGNGTAAATSPSTYGAVTANVATYSDVYYGETSPIKCAGFDQSSATVLTPNTTPSASNPAATMRFGAGSTNSFPYNGKWCETLIFKRVLSEWERQLVREYIQARYGIAAPVWSGLDRDILQTVPFAWARFDSKVSSVSKVLSLLDKARPGHIFTQATTGLQCPDPVTSAAFNGQLVGSFASTRYASSLPASAWAFNNSGAGKTNYVVVRPNNQTGSQCAMGNNVSTRGSNFYFISGGANLRQSCWNGTVDIAPANAARTLSLVSATVLRESYSESVSPKFRIHDQGSLVWSGASSGTPSATSTSTMSLGDIGGGGLPSNADFAEWLFYDRDLSAAHLARVSAYMLDRYGKAG